MAARSIPDLNRNVLVPEEKFGSPYLEVSTGLQVHNRILRVALFCAMAVILALAGAGWKIAMEMKNIKPLVVRVDPTGQATVAPYVSMEYQPQEKEIRYFLMHFVRDHYGRVRATARDAFQRKLFFLDAPLSRAVMEEETRTKSIGTFLAGSEDEVEVYVTNIAVEDLRRKPYKGSADFEKVFRSASDGRELKRTKYTAHFVFTTMDRVPIEFVPVNPLGLVITYFREDEAF